MINIILNAKDAMKNSHEKTLTIKIQAGEISIKDTGCGIPQEQIPHLFDPFYSKKEKGTGLGLSVCKSIVDSHGGSLKVDHQSANTRFVLLLPKEQSQTKAA